MLDIFKHLINNICGLWRKSKKGVVVATSDVFLSCWLGSASSCSVRLFMLEGKEIVNLKLWH